MVETRRASIPSGAHEADEVDDVSIALQVQQFLDEWHYRVVHSGMAMNKRRQDCVVKALDVFELLGFDLPETNEDLARKDETELVEIIVRSMPQEIRKDFEYFTLQLQLVVSATTRVRYGIEENDKFEVARIMDESAGDAGISQQILRQAVVEAAMEIDELNQLQSGWWKNMSERVVRLVRCSDDAEKAKSQLEAINGQLSSFSSEQSKKSKDVLLSMTAKNERTLKSSVFKAWLGHYVRYAAEKDIHDEFRRQIDEAQKHLAELKGKNKASVKNVLLRKAADGDNFMKELTFKTWMHIVEQGKEDKELAAHMARAQQKMANFKEGQERKTKQVMLRMTAGKDDQVMLLTLQAWAKYVTDLKNENALASQMAEAEAMLADHISRSSDQAKAVIQRMFGQGETGLLVMMRGAWTDQWKIEKQEKELDEAVTNASMKFSQLSKERKRIVKACCDRTNALEEELILKFMFEQWITAAKVERVISYFTGKIDTKNHQLESVQSMFKQFATQLEQGISTTPRSQRTKGKSGGGQSRPAPSDGGSSAVRPPALPAA
mmetsp:Transcript_107493/g.302536  ORF Transcript_107493/g.302536 Transcript_107493/m.302536 type:complete len:550 (-) Transcript_107493:263-1912(-)